ncbi:carbohydrate-binding module family 14 protein [Parasulfitobacter algicola]|uniref:Adenylosuccinate lyase n=1 Tax=Parasulfitobacter algicola TaxID=2614809 RepID=A0ABX2IT07_9RHOB|nr:carbohydrate-binding module family 14 protein [Sulfitobacter algicola]NSX55460.1 adenylosuccinate lyase [Sulfitobacter algicola]
MKMKTLLAAVALTLTPAFAFAAGCNYGKDEVAMSCASGTVWDAASKSCVSTTS